MVNIDQDVKLQFNKKLFKSHNCANDKTKDINCKQATNPIFALYTVFEVSNICDRNLHIDRG